MPVRPQALRVCPAPGPPGSVENCRCIVFGGEYEREEVTADPASFGCDDSLDCVGGYRPVDRIAAQCHDFKRGLSRQVMRCHGNIAVSRCMTGRSRLGAHRRNWGT